MVLSALHCTVLYWADTVRNVVQNLNNIRALSLQIIEWYEEYAEEFFQTHTELGESLDIALALEQEVKQFEDSTQVSR